MCSHLSSRGKCTEQPLQGRPRLAEHTHMLQTRKGSENLSESRAKPLSLSHQVEVPGPVPTCSSIRRRFRPRGQVPHSCQRALCPVKVWAPLGELAGIWETRGLGGEVPQSVKMGYCSHCKASRFGFPTPALPSAVAFSFSSQLLPQPSAPVPVS